MKPPEQVARELLTDMYALKSCLHYLPVLELEQCIAAALTAARREAVEEVRQKLAECENDGGWMRANDVYTALSALAKPGGGA
jgi:hypothetical protein